jgi:Fe-S-cluster containining protein
MDEMAQSADDPPWYRDGLRFTCTQCGHCCTGAPGSVWVTNEEIAAIAEFLRIDIEELEKKHVRQVGNRKTLIDLPHANWDCTFLDPVKRNCTIYTVRPRQCRTWPFWDSNVKTPETWHATCEVCPGSGQGDLVPLEIIETLRKVIRI